MGFAMESMLTEFLAAWPTPMTANPKGVEVPGQ